MPRPARRRPIRPWGLLTALAATVLTLAACGGDAGSPTPSSGSDDGTGWQPVTVAHAFGETTVEEEPTRVATWGWASNDAAISLGVVPVAMPKQSYGGDAEGVLPWNREAIEAAGAPMPTLLSESDEPPYEEIIAARPDVILALYSGLTQEQYDKLAVIAPTVAYPGEAWATPWRDVVSLAGQALGRTDEAREVVEGVDARVAEAAAAHPEFAGRTVAAVADMNAFYVYTAADPRVEFLTDLGFEVAPSVAALDTGESSFFYTLSYEETDKLTSDVLVSYSGDQAQADAFAAAPSTTVMPQVRDGALAPVVGTELIAAVSPPTALSLTWGLDPVVSALSTAVANLG